MRARFTGLPDQDHCGPGVPSSCRITGNAFRPPPPAQTQGQLVDRRPAGDASRLMPRAFSICCWPPDRFAAGSSSRPASTGNRSSTPAMPAGRSPPVGAPSVPFPAVEPRPSHLVLGHRQVNTPAPPGISTTPWPATRRRARSSSPVVEDHCFPVRRHQARHGLSTAGLPGPVGAEQGDHRVLLDVEVHVEEHPDPAVGRRWSLRT